MNFLRNYAHVLLGLIRTVNGTAALLAPDAMARQAGVDPAANPAAPYVLRLFGVRTVLIGVELLRSSGEERRRALNRGVLIHASDTTSAALAGAAGQLPPSAARKAVAISTVNTLLALIARR
ncbi:MAG: hypothetical protein QOC77_2793 [Thermoleophilaceae bacterium]|jgi:uncharacterized protein YjeT (DUF2065 family)|nr:hypothetical protein [Thermoleophilaceae bacterium]MEA2470097.1 hypothetical protein [Thermoleophilaceae bacterium]